MVTVLCGGTGSVDVSLILLFLCLHRIDLEDAKQVHRCLKQAAGIFLFIKVWTPDPHTHHTHQRLMNPLLFTVILRQSCLSICNTLYIPSYPLFLHCCLQDSILPKLPARDEKGVDTDPRVVEAYAQQCQAEAQEGQ